MNDVTDQHLDTQQLANQVLTVKVTASTPISAWAIRNWCHVMGVKQSALAPSMNAHVYAPPVMLQIWTVLELQHHERGVNRALRQAFSAAGYPAIVATNYDLRSLKLAQVGDLVTTHVSLDSISPRKTTPLGDGYFATEHHEWFNQRGDKLGELNIRCFYFRPVSQAVSPEDAPGRPSTRFQESQNDRLEIPVDTTLIIAGAMVGNDFELVHHDPKLARSQGLPDIIMNIATSAAMVVRYAEHCQPDSVLTALSMRLGVPCCPGDVLYLSGEPAVQDDGVGQSYSIIGMNHLGEHLKGTMAIQSPRDLAVRGLD